MSVLNEDQLDYVTVIELFFQYFLCLMIDGRAHRYFIDTLR